MSAFAQDEILRYSRHFSVARIGIEGQKKLKNSSVLLIGAGGIGSPAALYLTAMGIGRLGIVDHDTVDISNLQRQILYSHKDCGDTKVGTAEKKLNALNYHVRVEAHPVKLTPENAEDIISNYDIVVDGSDNYPTRYLTNDICALLGKPLISASIYQFSGQLGLYNYQKSACYRCIYPSPPPEGLIPNCAAAGVLGTIPGILATMAATEVIKVLLNFPEAKAQLVQYDALTPSIRCFETTPSSACPICHEHKSFAELERFDNEESDMHVELISSEQLAKMQKDSTPFHLIDVRQAWECAISNLNGSTHIPLDQFNPEQLQIEKDEPIIIYCRSGVRSHAACESMLEHGYKNVYNLEGGILNWAKTQDSSCAIY